MNMPNLGNIKRFIILNLSRKRILSSLVILIIGIVELTVSMVFFYPNTSLDNIIRGFFIAFYGGIEFITGLAGLILKFKSDFDRFAQVTRYIIIILLFIPYIAVLASFLIQDPVLTAFRLNALILSLVSLINLSSIPVIKHLYSKEP
ncbi:MAG: hypothetical protein QW327_06195 [Candidatus Odinarchaeota archaeon]